MNKKRKKTVKCPYCGHVAVLRPKASLREDFTGDEWVYVCSRYPECDSYVGVIPGTKEPMGTLANPSLRAKRIEAHKVLGKIWKSGLMSRKDAYRWLRESLGMKESQAHIALFSDYLCGQTIERCRGLLKANHIVEGG